MGTDDPESATPLVVSPGNWPDAFTLIQTGVLAPAPFPVSFAAVTLNGMMSPLEVTFTVDWAGDTAAFPVVYVNVRAATAPAKSGELTFKTDGGLVTESVTATTAGAPVPGTLSMVIEPT